jgi:hypothetical protein
MKMIKILGFVALLFAHSAFAITPENGWWWNPQESGMGFNIESQNGTVFIATFVYDNSGNPIWYSGSGQIDANSTLTANLQISSGGPCVGCTYRAPSTIDAAIPITITFKSRQEANVTWLGSAAHIQRFQFNIPDGLNKMLGEWVFELSEALDDDGSFVSKRVNFNTVDSSNSTANGLIVGSKVAGGTVGYHPDFLNGYTYLAIIDASAKPQHYYIYAFNFDGINRIAGVTAVVSVNANGTQLVSALEQSTIRFEGYRIIR